MQEEQIIQYLVLQKFNNKLNQLLRKKLQRHLKYEYRTSEKSLKYIDNDNDNYDDDDNDDVDVDDNNSIIFERPHRFVKTSPTGSGNISSLYEFDDNSNYLSIKEASELSLKDSSDFHTLLINSNLLFDNETSYFSQECLSNSNSNLTNSIDKLLKNEDIVESEIVYENLESNKSSSTISTWTECYRECNRLLKCSIEKNLETTIVSNNSSISDKDISCLLSISENSYKNNPNKIMKDNTLSTNYDEIKENANYINLTNNKILAEIYIQMETINQVLKALRYCRNNKKFYFSIEHISAEKILLISAIRRNLLIAKSKANEYSEIAQLNVGILKISQLKFLLNRANLNKKTNNRHMKEYFLCVLYYECVVYASDIVEETSSGQILFNNLFQFNNLPADFSINICLFSIRNHQQLKKKGKYLEQLSFQPSSLFCLHNQFTINLSHLNDQQSLIIRQSKSTLSATVSKSIKIEDTYIFSGFLTISKYSSNHCPTWYTYWCLLEGTQLKCWYCPSEIQLKPFKFIDLKMCKNFGIANTEICAKSKTLYVQMINDDAYLLSTKTQKEFQDWFNVLTLFISAQKIWK